MLPRVLEGDEDVQRDGEGEGHGHALGIPVQHPFAARTWARKCRPKLDGHTHSRLSVICIIKEKKKKERKERRNARERKREEAKVYCAYIATDYRYRNS